MINPVAGQITSYFEYRVNPITSKYEFHNGIDIAAKEGTTIVAVEGGCVIDVGFTSEYGNYIKYQITDEYVILYAHCKEIFAKKGDKIYKSQTIASVGATGMATGPHLHYSIIHKGVFVDPKPFLTIERGDKQ